MQDLIEIAAKELSAIALAVEACEPDPKIHKIEWKEIAFRGKDGLLREETKAAAQALLQWINNNSDSKAVLLSGRTACWDPSVESAAGCTLAGFQFLIIKTRDLEGDRYSLSARFALESP